jgi:hypothetical protein
MNSDESPSAPRRASAESATLASMASVFKPRWMFSLIGLLVPLLLLAIAIEIGLLPVLAIMFGLDVV